MLKDLYRLFADINTRSKAALVRTLLLLLTLASRAAAAEVVTKLPSMEDLIANPESYSGQLISVFGYLSREPGYSLFLTREHADNREHEFSADIANPDYRDSAASVYCGGHYAIVEGRFIKRPIGNADHVWSYTIGEIERIQILKDGEYRECYLSSE